MTSPYIIVGKVNNEICTSLESCDFCSNKVNPDCLEADEKNLAEQGGGYACAACANEIEKLDSDDVTDNNIYADNVFDCVNIGDDVFDRPDKLLGKCFYKSKDNSKTICLEKGRLAIWIKGFCLKQDGTCDFPSCVRFSHPKISHCD